MILARSVRRTFVLDGDMPEQSVRFLQALPDIPDHPTTERHVIRVHRRPDGFVDADCSWGRTFTGSDRTLTRILDNDFFHLALADAGAAPILASTVLRSDRTRIALIGNDDPVMTQVSIALIERGVAFEGAGFAFVISEGLQPHPRKPRLNNNRGEPSMVPGGLLIRSVAMPFAHDVTCSMIDPTFGGQPWRVTRDPVKHFVFVEYNDHGCASMTPIALSEALKRTMRRIHVPVTNAGGLSLIYKMLSGASYWRLSIGPIDDGADLILRYGVLP